MKPNLRFVSKMTLSTRQCTIPTVKCVFLKIRVFLFVAVIKCKTAFEYRCL